jgi:signal peptidase
VTSAVVLAVGAAAVPIAGLATGGWRVLPILGDSMRPSFAAGDVVLARRAPVSSVRLGDVLVYNIPVGDRQLTAHRVIEVHARGDRRAVRTKGDANPGADPWVARLEADVAWKVEGSVPLVGHVALFATGPWIRSAMLSLIVAAFLLIGLRAVWRAPRENDHDPSRGSAITAATA